MKSCRPLFALCLLLGTTSGAEEKQDALQSIESTRGGRHWVDEETASPKSPEESRRCFQIEPGARIELFAAEPLVLDPVSIAFDRRGRMFVVEYADYPTGAPDGKGPLSRVVMLEDTDADGRADRRKVFADGLDFAHSLMALNGGILVGAKTEIVFLKDTDGDNIADVREVWFKGFKPAHPQMQIGNPRWGLDNWIYLNYGPGDITRVGGGEPPRTMPRSEFRFNPRTMEFGPASGLGQFGNTIDNWGRRFFCTNRNPIMTPMLPWSVSRRNPYLVIAKLHDDVGPSGGETRVYPLVEMKSNYLSHAGTHTSACGTTAYRGDLFGADFQHSVFVCEPIGHLVTRSIVKSSGLELTAQRARPKADFLASTDTWFRPASLATGPDGALYLADMYRLWVEHPKFLPPEIAKRLDWRAGDDRGRIWRIVPEGSRPRAFHPPKSTADLVALLEDKNGWRRHLGQRLLVQCGAKDAAPALRQLLAKSDDALTRLHALWTIDGLSAMDTRQLVASFDDADPHVRAAAVTIAASHLHMEPDLFGPLGKLAGDEDVHVRFQLALALGESDDPGTTKLLSELVRRDGGDAWFALAALTSAKDRSGAILSSLIRDKRFTAEGDEGRLGLVRRLATIVGTRGEPAEVGALLRAVYADEDPKVWWQAAALGGLATGLERHRGELGRTSLSKLLAAPPDELAETAQHALQQLRRMDAAAIDRDLGIDDRVAAIELLGFRPFDQAASAFEQLLTTHEPASVQLAAIEAMQRNGSAAASEIVLDRWPTLGPAVRGPALALLLRRSSTTKHMLDAMAEGKINASAIELDRRVRLLKHSDPAIRSAAEKLFGGAVSADRRAVARQYESALSMTASAATGAKVFQRVCATCHRIDGQGHVVGPDISDVRNRSREALLFDILDPNQKVEPRFTAYSIVTVDGRLLDGLVMNETAEAVVLQQPEGKQHIVARSEIEEMTAVGKSLMPEGVEKEITVQQMADLLEFLKSRAIP